MSTSSKPYPHQSFLLEPTKLVRLVDKMHEQFDPDQLPTDDFTAFMKDGSSQTLQDLNGVLQLDNSSRRKIERVVLCSTASPVTDNPKILRIEIDFGVPVVAGSAEKSGGASISVAGSTVAATQKSLSEIEEQVERSWIKNWPERAMIGAILGISLLLTLGPQVSFSRASSYEMASTMWLQPEQVREISEKLSSSGKFSDDDERDLVRKQIQNLAQAVGEREDTNARKDKNRILAWGCWLFLLLVSIILWTYGLPSKVFLWGDEKSRTATRATFKGLLWTFLIGVAILAPFSQLFLRGILGGNIGG